MDFHIGSEVAGLQSAIDVQYRGQVKQETQDKIDAVEVVPASKPETYITVAFSIDSCNPHIMKKGAYVIPKAKKAKNAVGLALEDATTQDGEDYVAVDIDFAELAKPTGTKKEAADASEKPAADNAKAVKQEVQQAEPEYPEVPNIEVDDTIIIINGRAYRNPAAADAQASKTAADAQTSDTAADAQASDTATDAQTSDTAADAQASDTAADAQTSDTAAGGSQPAAPESQVGSQPDAPKSAGAWQPAPLESEVGFEPVTSKWEPAPLESEVGFEPVTSKWQPAPLESEVGFEPATSEPAGGSEAVLEPESEPKAERKHKRKQSDGQISKSQLPITVIFQFPKEAKPQKVKVEKKPKEKYDHAVYQSRMHRDLGIKRPVKEEESAAVQENTDNAEASKLADTAENADTADNAKTADNADTAKSADTADNADTAKSADTADNAESAQPNDAVEQSIIKGISPKIVIDYESEFEPKLSVKMIWEIVNGDLTSHSSATVHFAPKHLPARDDSAPYFIVKKIEKPADLSSLAHYPGLTAAELKKQCDKNMFELQFVCKKRVPGTDYSQRLHLTGDDAARTYVGHAGTIQNVRQHLEYDHVVRILFFTQSDSIAMQEWYAKVKQYHKSNFQNAWMKGESYSVIKNQCLPREDWPTQPQPAMTEFESGLQALIVEAQAQLGEHEYTKGITIPVFNVYARVVQIVAGDTAKQLIVLVDKSTATTNMLEDADPMMVRNAEQAVMALNEGTTLKVRIRMLNPGCDDLLNFNGRVMPTPRYAHSNDVAIICTVQRDTESEAKEFIPVDIKPIKNSIISLTELTDNASAFNIFANRQPLLVDLYLNGDSRSEKRTRRQATEVKKVMLQQQNEDTDAPGPLETIIMGSRFDQLKAINAYAGVDPDLIDAARKRTTDRPDQLRMFDHMTRLPAGLGLFPGYPGSGKTTMLGFVLQPLVEMHKRKPEFVCKILVTSPLNGNCDVLTDALKHLGIKVIRLFASQTEKEIAMEAIKKRRGGPLTSKDLFGSLTLLKEVECGLVVLREFQDATAIKMATRDKRVVGDRINDSLANHIIRECALIPGIDLPTNSEFRKLRSLYIRVAGANGMPCELKGDVEEVNDENTEQQNEEDVGEQNEEQDTEQQTEEDAGEQDNTENSQQQTEEVAGEQSDEENSQQQNEEDADDQSDEESGEDYDDEDDTPALTGAQQLMKDFGDQLKKVSDIIIASADAVVATTSLASEARVTDPFKATVVVTDEAGKAPSLEIMGLWAFYPDAIKLMLGDPMQIRPQAKAPALVSPFQAQIGMTIFTRLLINRFPHALLQETNRFRAGPCDFLSKVFAQGQMAMSKIKMDVDTQDAVQQECLERMAMAAGGVKRRAKEAFGIALRQTKEEIVGVERTRRNKSSAAQSWQLLQQLVKAAGPAYSLNNFLIMSPYRGQVALHNGIREYIIEKYTRENKQLKKNGQEIKLWFGHAVEDLRDLTITTIDKFQGGERPILLFDAVATNTVGALGEVPRFYTAVSRGCDMFFFIFDKEKLQNEAGAFKYRNDTLARVRTYFEKDGSLLNWRHPQEWGASDYYLAIADDTKRKICLVTDDFGNTDGEDFVADDGDTAQMEISEMSAGMAAKLAELKSSSDATVDEVGTPDAASANAQNVNTESENLDTSSRSPAPVNAQPNERGDDSHKQNPYYMDIYSQPLPAERFNEIVAGLAVNASSDQLEDDEVFWADAAEEVDDHEEQEYDEDGDDYEGDDHDGESGTSSAVADEELGGRVSMA